MKQKNVLELKQVTHVYVNEKGAFVAIEDFNLSIAEGEFLALVGPSGCGKTTVLSLLAGLFRPTFGNVLFGGEKVDGPSRSIGYMLQQDYLFPWRSIEQNTLIGLEIQRGIKRQSKQEAEKLLADLGLPHAGNRYPHELSGGMRQRVALARTLVTNPSVLLLDEPFSALDFHIKLQLEELVQNTLRRLGKTAVLVTHDLSEAAAMCDRIIVLGRNPGHIRCEVIIPDPLRTASPQIARTLPEFQSVYEKLTSELDVIDNEGGVQDG